MGKLHVIAATFAAAGLLFAAVGCDDKAKSEKKGDTATAAKKEPAKDKDKDKGETKPAKAAGGEITMLEHLKAANAVMCKTLVKQKPGSTEKQCAEGLNKMSEANPKNKTEKVSKAKSDKCLEHLKAYKGKNIVMESAKGPCAGDKLK